MFSWFTSTLILSYSLALRFLTPLLLPCFEFLKPMPRSTSMASKPASTASKAGGKAGSTKSSGTTKSKNPRNATAAATTTATRKRKADQAKLDAQKKALEAQN